MAYAEELAAYEGSRDRLARLVRGLDDVQLATMVPCCPAWRVRDVVGHLTGVLEDRVAGRIPAGDLREWTASQVRRHHDEELEEVLESWFAQPLEASDAPPAPVTLAFDAVTHEHDAFQAVGVPGDTASDAVMVGSRRALERLGIVLGGEDAPAVTVRLEDGEHRVGGHGPDVALRTSRFVLMRLVAGRVSEREALSLDWTGAAAPVLVALFADGFFRLQPVDALGGREE